MTAHPSIVATAFYELEHELAEVKAGYHALDKNWERHHEACMGPIRQALGMPDATVPEIVQEIRRLKVLDNGARP